MRPRAHSLDPASYLPSVRSLPSAHSCMQRHTHTHSVEPAAWYRLQPYLESCPPPKGWQDWQDWGVHLQVPALSSAVIPVAAQDLPATGGSRWWLRHLGQRQRPYRCLVGRFGRPDRGLAPRDCPRWDQDGTKMGWSDRHLMASWLAPDYCHILQADKTIARTWSK